MPIRSPLRLPGQPHHPPRLALHVERVVAPRPDLMGRPTYVRDLFFLDDNDTLQELSAAWLYRSDVPVPPVPTTLAYCFPYARSPRGQVQWKRGIVTTVTQESSHAR